MTSMPTLAPRGELEPMIRSALAWMAHNEFHVFWGELERADGFLEATWDADLFPDFEPFLAVAKDSGARTIFVDCTRCVTEGLLDRDVADPSPDLDRLAASIAPHVGELAEVTLSWVGGRVVHSMTLSASWAGEYIAAWELADGEPDDFEGEADSEDAPDETEVRHHAEILARNPKFQAASSGAQWAYAARKALAQDVLADRALLDAVILEAKSIFAIEIKPEADRQLAEDVQALKEQGLTKGQIARRLGISANRMKTMF